MWQSCVWKSWVWKSRVWQSCVWKSRVCDKVVCERVVCDKLVCERVVRQSCVWKESVTKLCGRVLCDKVVCDKIACERNVRQSCVRVVCDKVVRLTKATRARLVQLVPHLPRKVKVDVTKYHGCHAEWRSMSPSATVDASSAEWAATAQLYLYKCRPGSCTTCTFSISEAVLDCYVFPLGRDELKIHAALSAISILPQTLMRPKSIGFAFLLCLAIFFIKKRLHGLSRWTYSDFAGSHGD